jgi:hypothetical protein
LLDKWSWKQIEWKEECFLNKYKEWEFIGWDSPQKSPTHLGDLLSRLNTEIKLERIVWMSLFFY